MIDKVNQNTDLNGVKRYLYRLADYINRLEDSLRAESNKGADMTVVIDDKDSTEIDVTRIEADTGVFAELYAGNIGTRLGSNPESRTVASGEYVVGAQVTLAKGTWLLLCTQAYHAQVSGGVGARYCGAALLEPDGTLPAGFVAGARGMSQRVSAVSGEYTVVQAQRVVSCEDGQKVGSVAYQSSGEGLLTYSGIEAIRII